MNYRMIVRNLMKQEIRFYYVNTYANAVQRKGNTIIVITNLFIV